MKQQLFQNMSKNEKTFEKIAKDIWDHPQVGYEETYASTLQKDFLKQEGFDVTTNVGEIETAFVAQWGEGSPIIGFLGEFDALPNLSQQVKPTYDPAVEGGPGHGCGHNLLGTGSLEAIVALKNLMTEQNMKGTIRYYGCPAEELLSGKSFMARSGAFDDLDLIFAWHPGSFNFTVNASMQALTAIEFFFKGRTAHAAAAPHLGRSALDGVELMDVGANFLREHVPDGTRIHYQITNGGSAPNVVPEDASVYYFIRSATRRAVDELKDRLIKIAEGAALMTETTMHYEIKSACYDSLPNLTLNTLMYDQWKEIPPLSYTEEEQTFAKELMKSLDPGVLAGAKQQLKMLGGNADVVLSTDPYNIPQMFRQPGTGSSDLGDATWIAPLGQVLTTCAPMGVQVHTWQATASFGSSLGMKGMHYAAKTMAGAALDALLNPEIIQKAKEEFNEQRGGIEYKCAIPDDVKPPKPTK